MSSALSASSAAVASTSRCSSALADQSSATVPATCGAAIDVPLNHEYPPGTLEKTSTPGADTFGLTKSWKVGPRPLKSAMMSDTSVAPTAKASGSSAGEPTLPQYGPSL